MKNSGFEKSLILLRGLPGSGKSTLAALLSEDGKYPVFSIDDYFTDIETGIYEFDYKNNHLAYKQCEDGVRQALENNFTKVIVHNTFTIDWEIEPYFKMAAEKHYKVFVATVENYHHSHNIHGISLEQIEKMASKYKLTLY